MTSNIPAPLALAVIVCCYTQQRIASLIDSVHAAREQADVNFDEIIVVVDNNEALGVELRSVLHPSIRIVSNTGTPGLSGARNTGVGATEADVVVFVDDDAVLRHGSLDAVRTAFSDRDILAVAGAVHARWEAGAQPWWFPDEFRWVVGCDYRGLPGDGRQVRNPIGAAMAVRRKELLAVGGFSDRLGRVGTVPAGCEETLMGIQLRQHFPSSRIIRAENLAVDHHVPEARSTLRYFVQRCRHEGRSKAVLSSIVGSSDGLAAERAFVLRTLSSGAVRYVRAAFGLRTPLPVVRILTMLLGLIVTATATLRSSLRMSSRSPRTAAADSTPVAVSADSTPVATDELVSVVIPTVGRPSLADTVRTILEQDHTNIEVLVVDNRPHRPDVVTVMAQFDDPRVRILQQPKPGVSAARNRGTAQARGSLIAYTDDDALPEPNWISAVLTTFRSDTTGRVGGVTGRVLGTESTTREQEWFEAAGIFDKGETPNVWALEPDPRLIELGRAGEHSVFFPYTAGECGTGNNMAFRAATLRAVGGFDERLGTGTPTKGGEDLDIYRSAILAGWAIVYNPEAVVRHYHRDNIADLRIQSYGYGTGMAASLTKLVFSGGHGARAVLSLVPRGLHMLLAPTSSKNSDIPSEWPFHLRLLEIWGYAVGPALYLRSHLIAKRSDGRS
ncbi:glycosyltransferase involved in cell wall biosynthesis [Rhodococcus sp. 27YEA15]|uniref:glycosyltransferase family 2 protein n=1 Tax=Rhodococcus sp. 27YEA15 TaxID=3156259 RepID=UPI003C79EB85